MAIERNRVIYVVFIFGVIALGLGSRADFSPAWVQLYLGDVLWALMIFLMIGAVFKRTSTYWVAVAALVFCFGIETSQLYQAAWINEIRYTRIGGLVLGFGFLWSDLLSYTVGVCIGVLIEKMLLKGRSL